MTSACEISKELDKEVTNELDECIYLYENYPLLFPSVYSKNSIREIIRSIGIKTDPFLDDFIFVLHVS